MNFLRLIIFPSKTLDQLNQNRPDFLTLYLIWAFATLGMVLPKYIYNAISDTKGLETLLISLFILPFLYYPVTYGVGYVFWIVAKGFKGVSSFTEMRILVVYSTVPFILQLIISIPFITVGIIKNNAEFVSFDNYILQFILWFMSFRILMYGIAKYNKFNWTITIFTWLIVTSVFGGLAYLKTLLR